MNNPIYSQIWRIRDRVGSGVGCCAQVTHDPGARFPGKAAVVFGILLIVAFFSSFESNAMSRTPPELEDGIGIYDPSLSADGKLLLFSLSVNRRMYKLGQLNLETEELTMFFDLPIERSWHKPQFSPDGKTILSQSICYPELNEGCTGDVVGSQIALIDVATLDVRLVTKGAFIYDAAAFSADGRYVTYSSTRSNDKLEEIGTSSKIRLNLETMEKEVLFPTEKIPAKFYSVGSLMEVGPGDYLFSAKGPENDQRLIEYATKLTSYTTGKPRFFYDSIAYSYQSGGNIKPLPENIPYSIGQLTVSKSGGRKVFIDRSRTQATNDDGYYNWELFLIEDGRVRQITNMRSLIHHPFISRDGNRIVFLADNTRKQSWDVWVMDLPDGQPHSTRLREIVTQDIKAVHQKALETLDQ